MPSYKDLIKDILDKPEDERSATGYKPDAFKNEDGSFKTVDINYISSDKNSSIEKAQQLRSELKHPLTRDITRIDPVADVNSYSPEFFDASFTETFGRSMMKGLGDHVIKGAGDMLELAANWMFDENGLSGGDGNEISRALQAWGTSMAENNSVFIPDELKPENLKWSSFLNPEFWSIHFAEYIPQIAEFILLGGAGSIMGKGLAKGAGKLAAKKVSKFGTQLVKDELGALTKEIAGSGKGLTGMLYKSSGELTGAGAFWSGTAGAGITNNFATGLLNASQFVNQNRESGIYSEEQLKDMGSDIMVHNMAWLPIEMASWGLTYAGGWKGVSKAFSSTKAMTKPVEELSKGMIKTFAKSAGKLMGKSIFEGAEESFQETFEDWTQIKAKERQTGYNEYDSYFDYYMSDDSRATRIISAASGLGGGAFGNIRSAINDRAENDFNLLNETLVLKTRIDDSWTEGVIKQRDHQSNQLMRLAHQEREDLVDGFIETSLSKKVIDVDLANELVDEFNHYKDILEAGKTAGLNMDGRYALMEHAKNKFAAERRIKNAEKIKDTKITNSNALVALNEDEKKEQRFAANKEFEMLADYELSNIAKADTAIANLMIGKKVEGTPDQSMSTISPYLTKDRKGQFETKTVIDSKATGIVSDDDYNQFYVKTDEQIYEERKKLIEKEVPKTNLKGKTLDLFNKLKNKLFNKESEEETVAQNSSTIQKPIDVTQKNEYHFKEGKYVPDEDEKMTEDDKNIGKQTSNTNNKSAVFVKNEDRPYEDDKNVGKQTSNTYNNDELLQKKEELRKEWRTIKNKDNSRITEINNQLSEIEKQIEDNKKPNENTNELSQKKEQLEKELEAINDDNNPRITEIDNELSEIEKQIEDNKKSNENTNKNNDELSEKKEQLKKELESINNNQRIVEIDDELFNIENQIEDNKKSEEKNSKKETTLSDTEKKLLDRALSSDPRAAGWKIHLKLKNTTENSDGRKATKAFLEKARNDGKIKDYKIGKNGDQTGKDVTIYVGSKDNTDAIAKSLLETLDEHLDANIDTDAALDDVAINGNKILARFDNDRIDGDMHQYGANGISIMKDDVSKFNGTFGNTKATPSEQQKMLDKADNRNKRIYGKYYTGTETNSKEKTTQNVDVMDVIKKNNNIEIDDAESTPITKKDYFDLARNDGTARKKIKLSQLKAIANKLDSNNANLSPYEKGIYKIYKEEVDAIKNAIELNESDKKIAENRNNPNKEKLSSKTSKIDDIKLKTAEENDVDLFADNKNKLVGKKQKETTEEPRQLTHDELLAALTLNEKNKDNIDTQFYNATRTAYYNHIMYSHRFGRASNSKLYAINKRINTLFPNANINIVLVNNLIDAIGVDSVGFAIGTTQYMSEDAFDNSNTFMHEMGHILYSVASEDPLIKKIIEIGIKRGTYKKVRNLYPEYVLLKDAEGKVIDSYSVLRDGLGINPETSTPEIMNKLIEELKKDGYVELPVNEQIHLLEEVFTHETQKPMSKGYDNSFNPTFEQDEYAKKTFLKRFFTKTKENAQRSGKEQEAYNREMIKNFKEGKHVSDGDIMNLYVDGFIENMKNAKIGFGVKPINMLGMKQKKKTIEKEEIQEINKLIEEQSKNVASLGKDTFPNKKGRSVDEIIDEDYFVDDLRNTINDETVKQVLNKTTKVLDGFIKNYNRISRKLNYKKGNNNEQELDGTVFKNEFSLLARNIDNAADFIYVLQNSKLEEINEFMDYLDTIVKPGTKYAVLSQMHFIIQNLSDYSGVKLNAFNGKLELETAFSKNELLQVNYIINKLHKMRTTKKDSSKHLKEQVIDEQMEKTWSSLIKAIEDIQNDNGDLNKNVKTVIKILSNSSYVNLEQLLMNDMLVVGNKQHLITTTVQSFLKNNHHINKPSKELITLLNNNSRIEIDSEYYSDVTYDDIKKIASGSKVKLSQLRQIAKKINKETLTNPEDYLLKQFYTEISFLQKNKDYSGQISAYNFRPLVEAIVNTNRRYRFDSIVKNAEGNNTPVKAVSNGLTREMDKMKSFIGQAKTYSEFQKEFSHILHSKRTANVVLKSWYDHYKKHGSFPEIIQDLGIESKEEGNLFENSSSNEQFIQGLNRFMLSNNNTYLQQIQLFGDSPRAFMLSVSKYSKTELDQHIKNAYKVYQTKQELSGNVVTFNEYENKIKENVKEYIDILNENAKSLYSFEQYKSYFDKTETGFTLNQKGINMVEEYAANSIVNTMMLADVLTPNIPFAKTTKVGKSATSQTFVPDKNHKLMVIPLHDPDKAMDGMQFILDTHAEKWGLTAGVLMELNNGFKFLNHGIERKNKNMKGVNQFKSYTTILSEDFVQQNPKYRGIYELMKKQDKKYTDWHTKVYGELPPTTLNTGKPSYTLIASSENSIKTKSTIPTELNGIAFKTKVKNAELSPLSLDMLNQNSENAEKYVDALNFDPKGNFVGLDAYNFGVQMRMDKISKEIRLPVQVMDNILTSAGNLDIEKAERIQRLFSTVKLKNLDKILKVLETGDPEQIEEMLINAMNLDEMDQVQRHIIEQNGIFGPRVNTITLNQLTNTIRKTGNKLTVAGTYAQPKSSAGYVTQKYHKSQLGAESLRDYTRSKDSDGNFGETIEGEAILPRHMEMDGVKARLTITKEHPLFKNRKIPKSLKDDFSGAITERTDIDEMYMVAVMEAKKRHSKATNENISKYVSKAYNDKGEHVGYFVKGDTVMATRVPSHGPSSTMWFEVVDFDKGNGNQITVPYKSYEKITGGDFDGDSLFIQTKTNKNPLINQAIEELQEMWLSKEFYETITAPMQFEDEINKIKDKVNDIFEKSKNFIVPGSPKDFMQNYDDYIVAKRNVGAVFNLHKILGMLAAYDTEYKQGALIDGKRFNLLTNKQIDGLHGDGVDSRNMKSGNLSNMLLDNKNNRQAADLGIDDNVLPIVAQLLNLGVKLEPIAMIMNHPIVKKFSQKLNNGKSIFFEDINIYNLTDDLKTNKKNSTENIISDPKNPKYFSNENADAILDMIKYFNDQNSVLQKAIKILSGHNTIDNNVFVLEKDIQNWNDFLETKLPNQDIVVPAKVKNNPNNKNFEIVAKQTLTHLKQLSFYYTPKTLEVLNNLDKSLSHSGLSQKRMYKITKYLETFMNSRLLGINNIPINNMKYIMGIEKSSQITSVFDELDNYVLSLSEKEIKNNLLLSKAITWNNIGNEKYITIQQQFFDSSSLTTEEFIQVQNDFNELPNTLQQKLMIYDLLKNGFGSQRSISPIFGYLNEAMEFERKTMYIDKAKGKYEMLSSKVINELQQALTDYMLMQDDSGVPKLYFGKDDQLEYNKKAKELKGKPELSTELNKFVNEKIAQKIKTKKTLVSKLNVEDFFVKVNFGDKSAYYKVRTLDNNIDQDAIKEIRQAGQFKTAAAQLAVLNRLEKYNPEKIDDLNLKISSIKDNSNTNPFLNSFTSQFKKKSKLEIVGKKQKDYTNNRYSQYNELSKSEFDDAMEFDNIYSDTQKEILYLSYKNDKNIANSKMKDYTPELVSKMSDKQLFDEFAKYINKDPYAYSVITSPILEELTQRMINEQTKLTKKTENGIDIDPMKSWMMANNIPSNHPATQAMVRIMTDEHRKFTNAKHKYTKKINQASENLYKSKFNFNPIKGGLINTIKKVYHFFLRDRQNFYKRLYGNIVEYVEYKNDKGETAFDFRLKSIVELKSLFDKNEISKEEYEFAKIFRETLDELKPYAVDDKKGREDYIPHVAMGGFETFYNHGILGLLMNSKTEDEKLGDVKLFFEEDENGNQVMIPFSDIKNKFMSENSNFENIKDYILLKRKAKQLLKEQKNEDGSKLTHSDIEIKSILGMSGMLNRFSNQRSDKATMMPSMDLHKALSQYVHTTLFINGNSDFKGFKRLLPIIDGLLSHNTKKQFNNINKYVKTVWKDFFIGGKKQETFGKVGDKILKNAVFGNLLYLLGWQGLVISYGTYTINNVVSGKYHNIKNTGNWAKGEARYWGVDKGFLNPFEIIKRNKRVNKILQNLNMLDINIYDDVRIKESGELDSFISNIALMPMTMSEHWIQNVQALGMLTDEEWNSFDDEGNYKTNLEPISNKRIIEIEQKVRRSQGKGYQPTDQRMIQMYSWGEAIMQFNRFLPTMFWDRFAKEDVDIYGREHIGTLRAVGNGLREAVGKMSPKEFINYRNSLSPELQKQFDSGLKGIGLSTVALMLGYGLNSEISKELYWDANYYANAEGLLYKGVPSVLRTGIETFN